VAGDLVGVGVQPFPEEGFHLVFAHRRPVGHRPQLPDQRVGGIAADRLAKGGQAAAHPATWGFAFGAVVIGQAGSAAVGGVAGGDLADQVQVPVPGGQFVQTHHRHITCGRRCQRPGAYATAVTIS
jgi:hypothetical protein